MGQKGLANTQATNQISCKASKMLEEQKKLSDKKLAKAAKYELKQKMKKEQIAAHEKSKSTKPEFKDPTKPGDKKILQDFQDPAFKSYFPKNVNSSWYNYWQKIRVLASDSSSKISIIGFPNKLNGVNHIGNAFQQSILDAFARYYRMRQKDVLRVEGFSASSGLLEDAFENKVLNDKKSKYSLSEAEFTYKIIDLQTKYFNHITEQSSKLGILSSQGFGCNSLDPSVKDLTSEIFIQLHNDGLIERRPSMINWSYLLHSPVSDSDIKYININGRTPLKVPGYDKEIEFGVINDIIYKIEDSDEHLVIATTKPETMFADVAIAVHPDDERYRHLVGKNVIHPLTGRKLPIILDDELVNINFGTGAVRLAPSNNIKDYNIGLKHGLDFIQIFNKDGTLNENCGEKWKGIKRLDSRKKILDFLKETGQFVISKDNPMRIQVSLKTGDVIEKRLHSHWWLNTSKLLNNGDFCSSLNRQLSSLNVNLEKHREKLQQAINELKENDAVLTIEKVLHKTVPSPSYFVKLPGINNDSAFNEDKYWVVASTVSEAENFAKEKFPGAASLELVKDNDDLDSWFFDAVYPLTALGWPKRADIFETYYHRQLLVSSYSESNFSLAAKSLIISFALTHKLPFKKIIFHPLVTDFNNRKLSKRLGNAFDPLFIIEGLGHKEITENFTEYANNNEKDIKKLVKSFQTKFPKGFNELGADVLRLNFLSKFQNSERDADFALNSLSAIDNDKKILSKIYQFVKIVITELNAKDAYDNYSKSNFSVKFVYDKWVLRKLDGLINDAGKLLESGNFAAFIEKIHHFWLKLFNDIYFEIIKNKLLGLHEDDEGRLNAKKILYYVLDTMLKLYHPVAPFITEELWQKLNNSKFASIGQENYPISPNSGQSANNQADITSFEQVLKLSTFIGDLVHSYGILKNNEVIVRVKHNDTGNRLIHDNQKIISYLNKKVSFISVINADAEILNHQDYVNKELDEAITVYLLINGKLNVKQEITKNDSKIAKAKKLKEAVEVLQNGKDYSVKASKELQAKHTSQVFKLSSEISALEEINSLLQKLKIDE